jgi:hypothetical protein
MFRFLKELLFPPKPLPALRCMIDFTRPTKDHWASFEGGDNFHARFVIKGNVRHGDEILVRMQSRRKGCYRLYSVHRDWSRLGDWRCAGMAVGYWDDPPVPEKVAPKIKGLLSDGTRWVRSDTGELAHLSSGFTKPASEFWKILARNEARRGWTDSMRATGNL